MVCSGSELASPLNNQQDGLYFQLVFIRKLSSWQFTGMQEKKCDFSFAPFSTTYSRQK